MVAADEARYGRQDPLDSAAPSPIDADPIVGQLVTGRYRVKGRIGEGGMGTVYLAIHEAIEKKVALKILNREYSANREVVDRFKLEAVSASRIKHPNVIDVFDFGQTEDGSCFIAMELLEGYDLGELLSMRGFIDPPEAIRILLQIAKALGLAHSRGVVHRDLKPENVFLQNTPEGERIVKIVDFGIAQLRGKDEVAPQEGRRRRLTKTGMIFGTPEYMAPEQARGVEVDHRTDVYAAGIILYEMLSGGVPFVGDSFLEVLNQHVLDPAPPLRTYKSDLTISAELEGVVTRMLEKRPDDRFPNMKEVSLALLGTPEGRAMRVQLSSSGGFGAEFDVATSLMSTDTTMDGNGRKRSAKTESGHPPPMPVEDRHSAPTGILGTRDRTPPRPELPISSAGQGLSGQGSSLPLIFGLITLFLLVCIGAAWSFLSRSGSSLGPEKPAEKPAAASTLPSAVPATAANAAPAAPVAQAPVTPSAGSKVKLSIVTEPAGAVVSKDGFQVCDASPCEVEVEAGAAVTVVAQKGAQTGQAKVLAHRDQSVTIALRAPVKKAAPAPKLCEVTVDGLKILRPCE
jgi:eukaryotic-like serine/threonine-protein kinase